MLALSQTGTYPVFRASPVVELNLMGYANDSQIGTGLRQRLYSRAFIIGSVTMPQDRFAYVVLDTQSGDTALRYGILSALAELGTERFAIRLVSLTRLDGYVVAI